jgi:hypothetical protein
MQPQSQKPTVAKPEPEAETNRTISFQCPDSFWEAVQLQAIHRRVSVKAICITGIAALLGIPLPSGIDAVESEAANG